MRDENKTFLDNLPSTLTLNITDKNLLFVHGSPNKINEYLLKDGANTFEVANSINEDALIGAHTHIPGIKEIPYAFERIVEDMTILGFPTKLIHSFESGLE